MNSKIYELFTRGFQSGHFTRIGGNDSLNLYRDCRLMFSI